jgi:PIN domain nuclease of toxin-antitoxin system
LKLLLDTHIAIWAALDPGALTEGERKRMAEAGTHLVLSAVTVWELRLKWHSFHISGSRKSPVDPADVVAFATAIDWELLPLTARHAAAELTSPLGHKDPFDELLLVQAQEEGMRLLTRDTKLMLHPFAIAGGQDWLRPGQSKGE